VRKFLKFKQLMAAMTGSFLTWRSMIDMVKNMSACLTESTSLRSSGFSAEYMTGGAVKKKEKEK